MAIYSLFKIFLNSSWFIVEKDADVKMPNLEVDTLESGTDCLELILCNFLKKKCSLKVLTGDMISVRPIEGEKTTNDIFVKNRINSHLA